MKNRPGQRPKAILCWSGGKDSAFCLHQVLQENRFEVRYLLTTLHADNRRVSMHGLRESLLEAQAESLGLPLLKMFVSEDTYTEYEARMEAMLLKAKSEGIRHVIFGDIFLEDLRRYREQNLARVGMTAVFPLWKRDTGQLIRDILHTGFQTITCCVQEAYLGKQWLGKVINEAFISCLPDQVDPCGEHGEFHTFCFAGPLFRQPLVFTAGPIIYKPLTINEEPDQSAVGINRGFWYCDLE